MNLRTICVLARAEMRSCRRLARTWVFVCIALALCTLWYALEIGGAYQTWWPEAPSGWSSLTLAPQYRGNKVIYLFAMIFAIGIIFLCFDIRARDVTNRISDVVDSKPANNLEITIGRLLGILLLLLVPILFFLVAFTCYEVLAHFLELSYRYGLFMVVIAWRTLFNTMIFLAFCGSVVCCLAVLVRNRLLVALISLGLLYGLVMLSEQPIFQLEEISIYSNVVSEPFTASKLVFPISLLLLSAAFIAFTSSLLPRTRPRLPYLGIGGTICLIVGALSLSGLMMSFDKPNNIRQEWIAAHDAESTEAFPDILHLHGNVDLFPGENIQFDLTLTVSPPASNPTDSVVFSLNPGFDIQEVYIDGNVVTDFTFGHGLLKVAKSEWTSDVHQLRVTAQGIPNEHFAYLDQARDFSARSSVQTAQFGTKNYIFHSNFVALLPSVKWYPTSGTAMYEDLLEERPRDVFTTDITVSVPQLWKVAMVGNREITTREWTGKRKLHTHYRFRSQAPVPELALISSEFDQRGKKIEGIGVELLFSKKHTKNLEVLAPFASDIEQWVAEQIQNAQALSLEYQYGSFYVVEVPSTLRVYGGGWRMDSVLHPPGMMLVRESSFPTARFELYVQDQERGEEMLDSFIRKMVVAYFRDDLQGGSPHAGISRNFVNHLSSPTGHGSTALNYLLEQLSTQLIMKDEYVFVPSLWEFNVQPAQADAAYFFYVRGRPATRKRLDLLRTPSTWEEIERTPMVSLDFRARPISTFRALLTKSFALAEQMISYYGAEKVASFLSDLTRTYKGGYYTLEDFVEVAVQSEIDLNEWVLDWLEERTLPGFIVADVKLTKLKSVRGEPYEYTFVIHNAEPVAGYVEVNWLRDQEDNSTDPIFLHGYQSIEVAIQTHMQLLNDIWIKPNFARNRNLFPVHVPNYDGVSTSDKSAKPLVSSVEWFPPETDAIIVDDLDPGFSIVGQKQKNKMKFDLAGIEIGSPVEEFVDQGLPVRGMSTVGEWERKNDQRTYSFGRYRHTLALIARGKQNTFAKFAAELPHSGNWQLEYFVPGSALRAHPYTFARSSAPVYQSSVLTQPRANPNNPEEHYALQITDGQTTWNEQFDIANAVRGWNAVNIFALSSDKVDVLVSDFAGRADVIVFADAIRWTPVDSE
ncbi:MAG: M1 family metallopeptidase [Gammaproteobacteria bacterium]|nr:M1 family metallopeptidase [Gammaproteobacteria bacterium]MYC25090.1 M1 family metallopeptidase [Gammaproteobacteria bacterium]